MELAAIDQKKLLAMLNSLSAAMEEVLLGGLTAASDATRRTLTVSFQEAARMKLLTLSASIRNAGDELARFNSNEASFSRKRLSFFLRRTWLLAGGLKRAIESQDEAAFQALLRIPTSQPVDRLQVITLGAVKRFIPDSIAAFEFRLRVVYSTSEIPKSLVWSCVFPLKPGNEIPAEGFLQLPQKQKFKTSIFLNKKILEVEKAGISIDARGQGRLLLGEKSTVKEAGDYETWKSKLHWLPSEALARLEAYEPTPLDLEVELQEEVVLESWKFAGEPVEHSSGQIRYPIDARGLRMQMIVASGEEGKTLQAAVTQMQKRKKELPVLYGLMHYQKCQLHFQPLTSWEPNFKAPPTYLNISLENIDPKKLLAALKF